MCLEKGGIYAFCDQKIRRQAIHNDLVANMTILKADLETMISKVCPSALQS